MAIQYSGNAQTSTFTPATKQDIINGVETALLAMSWTTVSGHGTTNLLMRSATTPQGYAICVRLKDNGGNCVCFSLESTDGSLVGTNTNTTAGGYLIPTSGYVFAVTGCKYEAWIYVTPFLNASRTFVAFGCPYVPPPLVAATSRVGWLMGNTQSDTSTTMNPSLRTQLYPIANNGFPSMQAMFDGNLWSYVSGGTPVGSIGIAGLSANVRSDISSGTLWENGSGLMFDALISWGDSSSGATAHFMGQPWDCYISTAAYAGDQASTLDGHNWTTITASNSSTAPGTIFKATS